MYFQTVLIPYLQGSLFRHLLSLILVLNQCLNPLSTGKYPKTDTIEGSRLTQAKLSSCTRAKQCFADPRSSLIYREVCSDCNQVCVATVKAS